MLKELIKANDGVTYERSETVILIDLSQDEREIDEIEEEISDQYETEWCNCANDCCGHWRTYVRSIDIDGGRAMVALVHTQNV